MEKDWIALKTALYRVYSKLGKVMRVMHNSQLLRAALSEWGNVKKSGDAE
jgi:hypothetical protein